MADRPNPFDDIERFFEGINRSLDDAPMPTGLHDIDVDVAETDAEVRVVADLPGFEKEEISITLADRKLTIEADHEEEREERDARYVQRERSHRRLQRTVRLPADVDEESTRAEYTSGVLTVTLPKPAVDGDDSHSIDID